MISYLNSFMEEPKKKRMQLVQTMVETIKYIMSEVSR